MGYARDTQSDMALARDGRNIGTGFSGSTACSSVEKHRSLIVREGMIMETMDFHIYWFRAGRATVFKAIDILSRCPKCGVTQ